MRRARHWTDALFAGYQCCHCFAERASVNTESCTPVEAELWYGVDKSARQEQNRARLLTLLEWLPSLPFAGQTTQHFGDIRAHLARQGKPIGPYDLQIAAIARAHHLTLVTHNTKEFSRVPGLTLEDWETE
jgi:tRNA(fMet)-specific endonuclease VapC